MRITLDIETALYKALTDDGHSASAHMLPASLGSTLPHIHVTRTGGSNSDLVIDSHNVDFDVYAEDEADAMETASNMCAWIRSLAGAASNPPCYVSEVTTLPYKNPDPRHPTLARVTVKALITTRTLEAATGNEFELSYGDDVLITDRFEVLTGE